MTRIDDDTLSQKYEKPWPSMTLCVRGCSIVLVVSSVCSVGPVFAVIFKRLDRPYN